MYVEAYIIAWNEIETIDLTIKHYQKFCDRIFLFDNWSDDGTFEKAMEMGCDAERFGIKGVLDDAQYLRIKNKAWQNSNADWVIIVDSDEIVHHPKMRQVLEYELTIGTTLFNTYGWNIFSDEMPEKDFLEITTGTEDKNYAKLCVFSPRITAIDYVYGCHVARPRGNIVRSESTLALLHYRNIGGHERLAQRHAIYRKRLSQRNRRFGLGCHYLYDDERREAEFKENLERSTPLDLLSGEWLVQPTI